MSRLHLTVLQSNPSPDSDPTQAVVLYDSLRHEFVWNNDFSAFRAVRLKWWDDASYIAYQASDNDGEELTERMVLPVAPVLPPAPAADDDILF